MDPTFEYGLTLEGFTTAHIKPTITFGIEFNRNLINIEPAAVNLVADGWLRLHAEFETGSGGTSFCYGVDTGAEIYASIDVPKELKWTLPKSHFTISSMGPTQVYPSGSSSPACWSPGNGRRGLLPGADATGGAPYGGELVGRSNVSTRRAPPSYYGYGGSGGGLTLALAERSGSGSGNGDGLGKRAQVYGPLMPRMSGLRCPGKTNLTEIPPCPLCESGGGGVEKRASDDDGEVCVFEPHGDEPTCKPDSNSAKRGLLAKRTQAKKLTWHYQGDNWDLDCGTYEVCGEAKRTTISKWWGYIDNVNSGCQIDIEKHRGDKVDQTNFASECFPP